MNAAFDRLSTPAASSIKLEGVDASQNDGEDRPYYGKCQYKTGKCFNERTLKRNGEVHSLCEEHRIKQNLIQRRSDRKYQTVHAIRRRERSQRRAVLKKQVSMAVAQQLFYEHQQQKTLGVQLATSVAPVVPTELPRASMGSLAHAHPAPASVASLVSPLSIPSHLHHSHHHHHAAFLPTSAEGLASPILSFTTPSAFARPSKTINDQDKDDKDDGDDMDDDMDDELDDDEEQKPSNKKHKAKDDATPTSIDDFTPDAFLNLCCNSDDNSDALAALVPILSARAERELWTEADIDFLQTLLLA